MPVGKGAQAAVGAAFVANFVQPTFDPALYRPLVTGAPGPHGEPVDLTWHVDRGVGVEDIRVFGLVVRRPGVEQGLHRVRQAAVLQSPGVVIRVAMEGIDDAGTHRAQEADGEANALGMAGRGALGSLRLVECRVAHQGVGVLRGRHVNMAGIDLDHRPRLSRALHDLVAARHDQVGPGPALGFEVGGQRRTLTQGA